MSNPGRVTTRSALIDAVYQRAPSRACQRAIRDGHGRVEVLGGFSEIPPYREAGWLCRVTSRHGRVWLMAMLADEVNHRYRVVQVDEVPYQKWAGRTDRKAWNPYDGDQPRNMETLKWNPD